MLRRSLTLGVLICASLFSTQPLWAGPGADAPPVLNPAPTPQPPAQAARPAPAAPAPQGPRTAGSYSAGGSAGGAPQATRGNDAWNDPSDPRCRQGCTYDKANESLSLLMVYASEKTAALKELWDQGDEGLVIQELGDFCLSTESDTQCWERYLRYSALAMAKMQGAVHGNETSASALLSKQVEPVTGRTVGEDVLGMPVSALPGADPSSVHKSKTVYLPSYDELAALKTDRDKKDALLAGSVSEQYRRWLEEYPRPPSPTDFAVTKQILRDPSNPKAGTFVVVDKEANGQVKIDKRAYAAAKLAYETAAARFKADHDKLAQELPKRKLKPAAMPAKDSLSRHIFNQARGSWVRCLNLMAKANGNSADLAGCVTADAPPKKGSRTPSIAGVSAPRAPKPKAAPRPPVKYTGNEKIEQPNRSPGNETVDLGLDTPDMRTEIIRNMQTDVQGLKTPEYVDQIPDVSSP